MKAPSVLASEVQEDRLWARSARQRAHQRYVWIVSLLDITHTKGKDREKWREQNRQSLPAASERFIELNQALVFVVSHLREREFGLEQ